MAYVIKNLIDMSKLEDAADVVEAFKTAFDVDLTPEGHAVAKSADSLVALIKSTAEGMKEDGVENDFEKNNLAKIEPEVSDEWKERPLGQRIDEMRVAKDINVVKPEPMSAEAKEELLTRSGSPAPAVIDTADGFNEIEEDQLYDVIMEMPEDQRNSFLSRFNDKVEPEPEPEPEQKLGAVDILQQQKPKSGNTLAKLIGNLKF